jgi:hypothetical protein
MRSRVNKSKKPSTRRRQQTTLVRNADAIIPIPAVPRRGLMIPHLNRVRLVWSINGTLNNAAALGANTYVQVNYPTVPQLAAATTPGGLSDFSDLYQSARVIGVRLLFEATNLETFPITLFAVRVGETHTSGVVPTANDVNSAGNLRRVSENPSFTSYQCGPITAQPKGRVRCSFSLSSFLGTPWSGTSDDYTMGSAATTVFVAPVQILYLGYGLYSTNMSTTLVNGAAYRIHVEFDTVFFGARNQSS